MLCSRGLENVEDGETLPSMPHRPEVHRWYGTASWARRRAHQLMIEPLCRLCLQHGIVTPATVADHVTPHRGDFTAFRFGQAAACAPTATTGSTGIMPHGHESARMTRLPTPTTPGTNQVKGVYSLTRRAQCRFVAQKMRSPLSPIGV